MELSALGERELISLIRKKFSCLPPDVLVGIGDDAAVVRAGKEFLLITKDLLIEDVHFLSSFHPPFLLGRKSLNVNLSDIASMGGVPRFALLGLGLPARTDLGWMNEFFSGFKEAANESGVALVGGDISKANKILISVTLIGRGKNVVQRNGAKPGHLIYVSGTLGNAMQGLFLLKKGYRLGQDKKADFFLQSFLNPEPQVALGQELSRLRLASSMIDVSDGLSVDLNHICEESKVGAEIRVDLLPVSSRMSHFKERPHTRVLHGGEDYQLLFTVPPALEKSVNRLKKKYKISLIGKITRKMEVYLVDSCGKRTLLRIRGYEHFK